MAFHAKMERHYELKLRPDHIETLRGILKPKSEEYLQEFIAWIESTIDYLNLTENARAATPDIKTARSRASSILTHAEALLQALKSDPLSHVYFRRGSDLELGENDVLRAYRSSAAPEFMFSEILKEIIEKASALVSNEQQLRSAYLLPNKEASNQKNVTYHLWPVLFSIYQISLGKITYSPGGPLERFICLVHEAAGLPEPASATIKFVVNRWKLDKASTLRN